MSDIGEALVEWLLADSAIAALIGERLYPDVIPQDAARPAVAYQLIDVQHVPSRTAGAHLARSLIQFTCDAETYSGAKALATAIRQCWSDVNDIVVDVWLQGALIVNELDEYSEQRAAPVVRVDVAIWHSVDLTFQEGTT